MPSPPSLQTSPPRVPRVRTVAAVFAVLGLLMASVRVMAQPLPTPRAVESVPAPDDRIDPLIRRLDALGVTDNTAAGTQADAPASEGGETLPRRPADVELHLTSLPPGLGLLASRSFEGHIGAQRGLCRAPCTTWLDPGAYRLVVETRRGRDRAVPGLVTLMNDGELELHIDSRRLVRVGWWTASFAMVGGGLALFFDQRKPVPNNDIYCEINCFHHTTRQRALQTVGGLTTMFGGIFVRYALGARDIGRVTFHPHHLRTGTGTEEEGASDE